MRKEMIGMGLALGAVSAVGLFALASNKEMPKAAKKIQRNASRTMHKMEHAAQNAAESNYRRIEGVANMVKSKM